MKAAIIAAGLGERLLQGGISGPKPLVHVAGRPLIDHVLAAVTAAGIRDIACIVNEQGRSVEEHCLQTWVDLRFEFVRRTTPSSMESLFTLSPFLQDRRFLLLTVDAIFPPTALPQLINAAADLYDADGVLALSTFVDDEKPLRVEIGPKGRIVAIGPEAGGSDVVTAGFYLFEPAIFDEIAPARELGLSALRQFLGHLLARGYLLYGESVAKTVDVDRPEDIAVAESFIRNGYR